MKTDQQLPPPLKWAGGKRWLIPTLAPLWQPHRHRRLVEPFCGGLSVALGLQPDRALLNDANPHLINFYQEVQQGLVSPLEFKNEAEHYYYVRKAFNLWNATASALTPYATERAAAFYYLNRTGFNGLCRFNKSGGFNVPFGRYKTINYIQDFAPYRPTLYKWRFTCGDFEAIKIAPDDFIYADPPYDGTFAGYFQEGFGWGDQVRLVWWLSKHPGPVAVSNAATNRIVSLYESHGFCVSTIEAPRRISCNGDRTPALEVLATRNV